MEKNENESVKTLRACENILKDLFKKYERALFDYLIERQIDIWEKAYYRDKKPNFKKLCEFFCSKEEREWRSRGCDCFDIPF